MKDTYTAGGVVIGDHGTIALVRHRGDGRMWLFPKGHKDDGETDEQTARREIAEETGLVDLEYLDDLGGFERHPLHPDGTVDTTTMKHVRMFLFAAKPHAALAPSMEIEEARWVPFRAVSEQIGYPIDQAWFNGVFQRVRHAIERD